MRAAPIFVALLLLASCGQPEPKGLEYNQLSNLMHHGSAGPNQGPVGGTGLEPLAAADLGGAAARCQLLSGQGPILAYVGDVALVKQSGQLARLAPDGMIDQTGGFFANEALSVSVGRVSIGEAGENNAQGTRSPRSRVRVTNRRANTSNEFDADWRCG